MMFVDFILQDFLLGNVFHQQEGLDIFVAGVAGESRLLKHLR